MIGKIKANNSFSETTGYVVEKEKSRILGGTIAGLDSNTISHEFLMSRDINPNIERPVYHLMQSYSYSDTDTQNLTDDKVLDLAIRHFAGIVVTAQEPELLKEEGLLTYRKRVDKFIETRLSEYQFFVARHEDVKHTHTHLVASRINLHDGRCIPRYLERYRSQIVCRELEKDFGLQQLPSSWEVDRRKPSRKQADRTKAGDPVEVQTQLQDMIERVASYQSGLTFNEFVEQLETEGVEVRINHQANQTGISYWMDGISIRGSKLGRCFTYEGLQKQYGIIKNPIDQIKDQDIDQEPKPELSPLEQLVRAQDQLATRIAPVIQELWNREKLNEPNLSVAVFGNYQIRLGSNGQPELFKRRLKLLARSGKKYQGYGLSEQDCLEIEQINALSRQSAEDKVRQENGLQQQLGHDQVKKMQKLTKSHDLGMGF